MPKLLVNYFFMITLDFFGIRSEWIIICYEVDI